MAVDACRPAAREEPGLADLETEQLWPRAPPSEWTSYRPGPAPDHTGNNLFNGQDIVIPGAKSSPRHNGPDPLHLAGQPEVTRKRFQHMLPGPCRKRIPDDDRLTLAMARAQSGTSRSSAQSPPPITFPARAEASRACPSLENEFLQEETTSSHSPCSRCRGHARPSDQPRGSRRPTRGSRNTCLVITTICLTDSVVRAALKQIDRAHDVGIKGLGRLPV